MKRFLLFLLFVSVAICGIVLLTMRAARAPRAVPMYAHWPFSMAVSPDGRYLAATGGRTDAVQLYDFKTGQSRLLTTTGVNQFYQYRMAGYAMSFSPDSRTLAHGGAELGSYNAINTWDTATGVHLNTFAYLTTGTSVLYTPDGRNIVAAARDNNVHLWDANTGRAVKMLPGPGGQIVSLALSPDGRRVAIGTIAPTCCVQVRDLRSGRAVWTKRVTMPEGEVASLAFSPDGRTLARGGQRNAIYLHNADTGLVRATLSDPPPTYLQNWAGNDSSRTVAYSADGRYLAGGGYFRLVVWSTQSNKVVLRLAQAGAPYAFLPNSRALAASSSDVTNSRLADRILSRLHFPAHDGNVSVWSWR